MLPYLTSDKLDPKILALAAVNRQNGPVLKALNDKMTPRPESSSPLVMSKPRRKDVVFQDVVTQNVCSVERATSPWHCSWHLPGKLASHPGPQVQQLPAWRHLGHLKTLIEC